MKRVYKCDYCSTTDKRGDVVEYHESNCRFNPKARKCTTCKFQYEGGAPISGSCNMCKIKSLDHVEAFGEAGYCESWELNEDYK